MEDDDRVPPGARFVIGGRTVVLAFCAAFALLLTVIGGGLAVNGIGRLGETPATAVHHDPEHPEGFTTRSAGEVRVLDVLLTVMGAALVILMPLLLIRLGLEVRRAHR